MATALNENSGFMVRGSNIFDSVRGPRILHYAILIPVADEIS